MAPIVNGTTTTGPMVNGTSTSPPMVNGTASSAPITIKNGLDDSIFNQDIVKLENLPEDIKELCLESLKAREAAYAPYSKFYVGAAIRTKEGIITGCNVENASYGLAICAERTAAVKAVSQGIKDFSSIAIGADLEHEFCGPCGACRQFLCEFNPEIPIYLVRSKDHIVQLTSLATLLPESFTPKRQKFEFYNE